MSISLRVIRNTIVFASYNEAENLQNILTSLNGELGGDTLVVIADDSGEEYRSKLEEYCIAAFEGASAKLEFNYSNQKSGRGAAIRRTFIDVRSRFPGITKFIEADSDGSHRPQDIMNLLNSTSKADLLIGSRYINGSKIVGWSFTRRLLSKTLNTFIPKILRVKAKDLTNGLRRYSPAAIAVICSKKPNNSGFIYLSEVAKKISDSGLSIEEIPIQFEERLYGSSTVGLKELTTSLSGLLALIFLNK